MPMGKFVAKDIEGLTPAIDPAMSDKIFALSGKNFLFDSRGPVSAFGNRVLTHLPRANPAYSQGFKIQIKTELRCFQIDGDGIWEWKETLGQYQAIYLTPDTTVMPYAWTYGYLNGYVYLAHPRVGLLAYNVETRVCVPHERIGIGTPSGVISLAIDNGRLYVITTDFAYWSDPNNGLSFDPSLGGAGFQKIAEKTPGSPIIVTSYTKGCLVWTTEGVMRSEYTGDSSVYRHRTLDTEYRPINSFCALKIDENTVLVLDQRGIFQTSGDVPRAYSAVFNEFLMDSIQWNQLTLGDNARLTWDSVKRVLYVSISGSETNPIYETAYALYQPVDKWGVFNEPHYGILPILIKNSERESLYTGFVDAKGVTRYWEQVGSREVEISQGLTHKTAMLCSPVVQKPSQVSLSQQVTDVSVSGRFKTARSPVIQMASYFDSTNAAPLVAELRGLDSQIRFGLFRPTGSTAPDEMSEVVSVMLRMAERRLDSEAANDYALTPSTGTDFNLNPGAQSLGLDTYNFPNVTLRVIGTIDAEMEFDSAEASLVSYVKGARHYTCSVSGIWHAMEVSATNVGESFHINAFEISAIPAGRLL